MLSMIKCRGVGFSYRILIISLNHLGKKSPAIVTSLSGAGKVPFSSGHNPTDKWQLDMCLAQEIKDQMPSAGNVLVYPNGEE